MPKHYFMTWNHDAGLPQLHGPFANLAELQHAGEAWQIAGGNDPNWQSLMLTQDEAHAWAQALLYVQLKESLANAQA